MSNPEMTVLNQNLTRDLRFVFNFPLVCVTFSAIIKITKQKSKPTLAIDFVEKLTPSPSSTNHNLLCYESFENKPTNLNEYPDQIICPIFTHPFLFIYFILKKQKQWHFGENYLHLVNMMGQTENSAVFIIVGIFKIFSP